VGWHSLRDADADDKSIGATNIGEGGVVAEQMMAEQMTCAHRTSGAVVWVGTNGSDDREESLVEIELDAAESWLGSRSRMPPSRAFLRHLSAGAHCDSDDMCDSDDIRGAKPGGKHHTSSSLGVAECGSDDASGHAEGWDAGECIVGGCIFTCLYIYIYIYIYA